MLDTKRRMSDESYFLTTEFAGQLEEFAEEMFRSTPGGLPRALPTNLSSASDTDSQEEEGYEQKPNSNRLRRRRSVKCSIFAQQTLNPIRKIVDVMSVAPNPDKPLIKLHLGDPTVTGTLPPYRVAENAVVESLRSGKYNGYGPSVGFLETRQAIAEYASQEGYEVSVEDVIVTSGCSHALQMAIESIGERGTNMLMPNPGFPLYTTLMTPLGIQTRMPSGR